MGFKIQKSKSPESGDYTVRLTDIKEAQGLYGSCLKFLFEVAEGPYVTCGASMIRPARLVPGNKLDKTLQAMGVDTTTVTDELDTDLLKGKLFRVKITSKTSNQGKVFANVTDVLGLAGTAGTSTHNTASAAKPSLASTDVDLEEVPF